MAVDTHPSTHPPLPPTTEDERLSWLRLLRSRRVGIVTFYRLLTEHQSARAALVALPDIARAAGVSGYQPCPEAVALAELRAAAQAGARMICVGAPDYPVDLLDIDDPPPILWAIGDLGVLARPKIGIVGARNASSLGTRMARAMATDLAESGLVIVSGLARGIDAAAHHASLASGTIAMMAGGVDMLYPAENADLASKIIQTGLRLSEQPMGMQPQARHFPRRNRLVSGLSRAVVVIEAAARSGSLITARTALDQGREVLVVPGHPMDARSAGCNMLIRDGARLVRNAADVIEALPPQAATRDPVQTALALDTPVPSAPPPGAPRKRSLRETAALHSEILNRLGPTPLAEDQLIRDLGEEPRRIAPALVDLELSGQILRQSGGLISRVPSNA
ncbi:DNA-processing protein DprA [Pseudooceanicola sp.]|uniref:DNA-processing protein DprA n=1 Tax=Pseudooceanicola sp. TaxID=1914328 RepID=UPI00262231CC|nr:DNA-processing protein DprA [Pseudooceanicola sp.]MDF1856212.1 DNA-processing protein DprA [Pseudooceanicola sp.]